MNSFVTEVLKYMIGFGILLALGLLALVLATVFVFAILSHL